MLHGPNGIFGYVGPKLVRKLSEIKSTEISPQLKTSVLLNGTFKQWKDNNPSDWSVYETLPGREVSQVGENEGYGGTGTGACNLYYAEGSAPGISQNTLVVNQFYSISVNVSALLAGGLVAGYEQTNLSRDIVNKGSFAWVGRATKTYFQLVVPSAPGNVTLKQVAVYPLTDTYKIENHALCGSFNLQFGVTQSGIIFNYKDENNYLLVYEDTNSGKLCLLKCISGVTSEIASWSSTLIENNTLIIQRKPDNTIAIILNGGVVVDNQPVPDTQGIGAGPFSAEKTTVKFYYSKEYVVLSQPIYKTKLPAVGIYHKNLGYGKNAWNGVGTEPIVVDSTTQLKTALALNQPRVIQMADGIYDLSTIGIAVYVTTGNLVITGQDVTFLNGGLYIDDCPNVLIKNIKFRLTPAYQPMMLRLSRCQDVLIQNCSFSGTLNDDTLGSAGAKRVTIEWCIFNGCYYAYHPYKAIEDITVHHCLFYDIESRTIKVGDVYDVNYPSAHPKNLQMVNCVVADWKSYATSVAGEAQADIIGNAYIPSSESNVIRREISLQQYTFLRKVHVWNNVGYNNRCGWGDLNMIGDLGGNQPEISSLKLQRQWTPLEYETDALQAISDTLAYAGARNASGELDSLDQSAVDGTLELWQS